MNTQPYRMLLVLLQRRKNHFADREGVAQCKKGHKDRPWWSKGTLQLAWLIPHMHSGLTLISHVLCVGMHGQPAAHELTCHHEPLPQPSLRLSGYFWLKQDAGFDVYEGVCGGYQGAALTLGPYLGS